jgi:hypothetical protein
MKMDKKYLFPRAVLWFVAVYHTVVGLVALFSKEGVIAAAKMLGAYNINAGPSFFYIVKPFGVYLIAFGVSMALAAWDPIKNRALLSVGVVLFALRLLQRILTAQETQTLFNITPGRNAVTIAIVATFCLVLLAFRIMLYRDMHQAESPATQ